MTQKLPLRTLSRALAMALLADSHEPHRRTPGALQARVVACVGPAGDAAHSAQAQAPSNPSAAWDGWDPASALPPKLPAALQEQLRRLSALPARDWARLEPEDLATWLCTGRWLLVAGRTNPAALPEVDSSACANTCLEARLGGDSAFGAHAEPHFGDDLGLALHLAADLDLEARQPGHINVRQWTPAQLASAFCDWACEQGVQAKRWLLRPAHPGPQPIWLDAAELGSRAPSRWATAHDLTQALALTLPELLWLAPDHANWREASTGVLPASHYRHRLMPKRAGGLRLLEAPLPQLAQVQRRILDLALASVPVHKAAHGFVRGRNVRSHVTPHAGHALLIRFDLRDFFTHIHATRVRALWRALGHTRAASDLLTRLTTTRTPAAVRERLAESHGALPLAPTLAQRRAQDHRLQRAHLPQGAPTSPALANLCAFGLDVRLSALARRFGAHYSRYADDLVFSGPAALHGQLPNLRAWVAAIVRDEGFALRADKTRAMPAHQRQQVTGVVLNAHPNLSRPQFDAMKARLHRLSLRQAVPLAQRAPLLGQLQWAQQWLAPARQRKLQALFDAICFAPNALV